MSARDALHPQRSEMSDASMVRTLAAQAELIWPQELALFERYGLTGEVAILDVGCGTGDVTHRIAELFPAARVVGVDLVDSHLAEARRRYARLGERLRFLAGDATALELADASFDLVVCRHMLQAVPDPARVVRELLRVARPGGRLHLIAEDYHMLHFEPGELDPDEFWLRGPIAFGAAVGTDLRIGRTIFGHLRRAGAREIGVEHLLVDTLRADRGIFAAMMEAWRDGFAASIGAETGFSEREARAHFEAMIATLRDPERYAAWLVPVWTARR